MSGWVGVLVTSSISLNMLFQRTVVQTVVATDQDTGINNDILYDIIEVTDADSMAISIDTFVIDEDSGVIYTNAALDHEISNRYTIIVKVCTMCV